MAKAHYLAAAIAAASVGSAHAEGPALVGQVPNSQIAITPSDSTDIVPRCNGLYVGSGGDLRLSLSGGGTATWVGVLAGAQYWLQVTRVLATGTTASNLICLR